MRIWFDISNSPHINFFRQLIAELEADGHQIFITSRPLANTNQLLDLHGLPYTSVGVHYGKNFVKKLCGYPIRVMQLYRHLRPMNIDVAISHSSFHSPVTARLLGCRSIYCNDNEHAMGNIPSFLCASTIMIPEFLRFEKVRSQGARRAKTVQYPGVKEGVYLWSQQLPAQSGTAAGDAQKPKIYVRPEPWTAQYYSGNASFLEPVLAALSEETDVILMPRGHDQLRYYQQLRIKGVNVAEHVRSLAEIAADCSLFIGAGGTMTREMAVLGIPTISVYQGTLLDVDEYLVAAGAIIHAPTLTAEDAFRFLETRRSQAPQRMLLEKGREAYKLLKTTLLNH